VAGGKRGVGSKGKESLDKRSGGGTASDPKRSLHSAPAFGFSPRVICNGNNVVTH